MSPEGSFAPADCHPGPHGDHWWGGYEDSLFEQHVLAVIDRFERDESLPEADQKKFFIVWAPHIVHAPLQVPDAVYERFNAIGPTDQVGHERQLYAGMVNFADMAIGNVTAALKAKGIWNDLLLVFLSDNGGPISKNGTTGANNVRRRLAELPLLLLLACSAKFD